jgi:cyanate permease
MMGLRKLIDAVMMNWMPTIAHSVRCQPESLGLVVGRCGL